ncbi:MAG: hypothetical protein GX295_01300 [Syntrophomonadaceae bacterium]|nr:hypothetical protein [Syntrophomonadaceae bacterium]
MPNRTRRWLPLMGILLLLQMVFSLGISNILTTRPWKATLPEGITIAGVTVAGLTEEQAIAALRQAEGLSLSPRTLLLGDGVNVWSVDWAIINGGPDYAAAVEQAFQRSRGNGWGQQVVRGWDLYWKPLDLKIPVYFSSELLQPELERIAGEYFREQKDARLVWKEEQVLLEPEIIGRELDQEETIKRIMQEWHWERTDPILLAERIIQPEIISKDLAGINSLLGSFSTRFNPSDIARTNNLKLAVNSLNNTLLLPGAEFSFYDRVGPRTAERGYQKSKIIVNGKAGIGVGGGVCQVTSTLYNVVLQAGLGVTERFPHSRPVGYVPVGQDAAVMGKEADFKFKNTSPHPVYILSEIEKNQIIISLLGISDRISVVSDEDSEALDESVEITFNETENYKTEEIIEK